jgi:hypothetical protein
VKEASLIVSDDIYYKGVLDDIKKAKEHFQPIFEAFTNSFESIKSSKTPANGKIIISLFLDSGTTEESFILDKIVVEDNGIGFDQENFDRLNRFKDNRKGFFNKGSGRIQLLHFFNTATYVSIFKDKDVFKQRNFVLSKQHIKQNAIVSHYPLEESEEKSPKTILTLKQLLDPKDEQAYEKLTAKILKQKLIDRYIMEFCNNRDKLPQIKILEYIDRKPENTENILQEDIPQPDKEEEILINYYKLSNDGERFEPTSKQETFKLTAFKISGDNLDKNEIKLISKGEIVSEPKIELNHLTPKDQLSGKRFLFLISGNYLNEKDDDTRGVLNIPSRQEYKKEHSDTEDMFCEGEIFLDDIAERTNATALSFYEEIKKKVEEKTKNIEDLEKMFLLNKETVNSVSFKLEDSEEKILERVYTADVKIIARKDSEIKQSMQKLEKLNPNSEDYRKNLDQIASELVRSIPLQNRVELTHYVARRKLVLDLFDKILKNELEIQDKATHNFDEKLLHNLIFQQSSDNPNESDLWLINEDFIYFKGTSEYKLCDIEIEGKKVLKKQFSEEEEKYLKSLGENRKIKRPDILLFPDEGKCIIIEFKNPDANVSYHLTQIDKYAFLIKNYTEELFHLDTFYGYLIGEQIHHLDVRGTDPRYMESYHFDYLYRPSTNVLGLNGCDGSLYTEVIKYSTLLKRAIRRNEIFIKKLTGSTEKASDNA